MLAQSPYQILGQNFFCMLTWKSQGLKLEFLVRLAHANAPLDILVSVLAVFLDGQVAPPSVTLGV